MGLAVSFPKRVIVCDGLNTKHYVCSFVFVKFMDY